MKNLLNSGKSLSEKLFMNLIIASALLFLSSCEKEATLVPSQVQSTSENRALQMPVIPEFLLRIDHISQGAISADYSMMLWTDGTVQFTGRYYVPYPGVQYTSISLQDVDYIRNMYLSAQFSFLPSVTPIAQTPFVKTTFSGNALPVSVIDLNNGSPMMILKMREKAEEIMGIDNFINGRRLKPTQNID